MMFFSHTRVYYIMQMYMHLSSEFYWEHSHPLFPPKCLIIQWAAPNKEVHLHHTVWTKNTSSCVFLERHQPLWIDLISLLMNRSESYLLYFLQTFFIVASRSERDLCDFFKMCVLMSCHENRKSFQTLFSSLYQPLVRLECEWLSVLLTQGPLLHAAAVLTSDPMQLCSYCDHITRTVSNGFHGKKKNNTIALDSIHGSIFTPDLGKSVGI